MEQEKQDDVDEWLGQLIEVDKGLIDKSPLLTCIKCNDNFEAKKKWIRDTYYIWDLRRKYCHKCRRPDRKRTDILIYNCKFCKKDYNCPRAGTGFRYKSQFCSVLCSNRYDAQVKRENGYYKLFFINENGYRQLWIDGKYILEHRSIMENKIGRKLYDHEEVHHKNGQRADNNEDNLEIWSHSHPSGQKIEDKLQWSSDFINQYSIKDNISNSILSFGT